MSNYKHYGSEAPFYADFDEDKNYMKVLYIGGKALQSRELIDQQSYMQAQLSALGSYFFKDGKAIDGAKVSFSTDQRVLRLDMSSVGEYGTDAFDNYIVSLSKNMGNDFYYEEVDINGIATGLYYSIRTSDCYVDPVTHYVYVLFSYTGVIFEELTGTCDFRVKNDDPNETAFKFTTAESVTSSENSDELFYNPMYALTLACTEGTIFVDGCFIHVPATHKVVDILTKRDITENKKILNTYTNISYNKDVTENKTFTTIKKTTTDSSGNVTELEEYYEYQYVKYYFGYTISRSIVTARDDYTLNDTAVGTYNYKSPGASRLQIMPELTAYYEVIITEYDDKTHKYVRKSGPNNLPSDVITGSNTSYINFIPIIIQQNNNIIKDQVYEDNLSESFDTILAERTYEESGSYTVNPWKVNIREVTTDDLIDVGYNEVSSSDLNSNYIASIQPGIGYIYGHRIQTTSSVNIVVPKSRTSITKKAVQTKFPDGLCTYGKLLETGTTSSSGVINVIKISADRFPKFSILEPVKLMCPEYVYNTSTGKSEIATEIIKIDYDGDGVGDEGYAYTFEKWKELTPSSDLEKPRIVTTELDVTNNVVYVYLTNMEKYQHVFSSATRIVSAFNGNRATKAYVSTLKDKDSSGKTYINNPHVNYIDLDTSRKSFATLTGSDYASIVPTGYSMICPDLNKVDTTKNLTTLINRIDQTIKFNHTYTQTSTGTDGKIPIELGTNMTIQEIGSKYIVYVYNKKTGEHLNLKGLKISQTTDSDSNLYYSIVSDSNSIENGNDYEVCIEVRSSGITPKSKTLTIGTMKVVANTNSTTTTSSTLETPNYDTTTGIVTLNCVDVIAIKSITSSGKTLNVTSYKLNNGQKDYYYDYATVSDIILDGSTTPESNLSNYVIEFFYFEHSTNAVGIPYAASSYTYNTNKISKEDLITYFGTSDLYSIIPSYISSVNGVKYSLRDCLDFRTDIFNVYDQTKSSTTENVKVYNNNYPVPGSTISFDCDVYLPRIDAIWVDKNGTFGLTTGIPSETPKAPEEKDGTMTLYYLYNSAYCPDLSYVTPKYVNNQRYTMKDIAKLENRIEKIEDVVSLSLLEQSAVNMQIKDSEGYDKYKSGIFTDNFSSFDYCNTEDESWEANRDSRENAIRPDFKVEEVNFKYIDGVKLKDVESSRISTTVSNGTSIMIPPEAPDNYLTSDETSETYNDKILVEWSGVSNELNIQSLMFYTWNGKVTINPAIDTWIDDDGINYLTDESESSKNAALSETKENTITYGEWVSNVTDINGVVLNNTIDVDNSTSVASTSWNTQSGNYTTVYNNTSVGTGVSTSLSSNVSIGYTTQATRSTLTNTYSNILTSEDTYTNQYEDYDYMRVKLVAFTLTGMCGNCYVGCTMDGVTCRLYSDSDSIVKYGEDKDIEDYNGLTYKTYTAFKTDEYGSLTGFFMVPENMPVGTVAVVFYDISDTSDSGCKAITQYTASGKRMWTDVQRTYKTNWTAVASIGTESSSSTYNTVTDSSYTSDYSYSSSNSTSSTTFQSVHNTYVTYNNSDPIAETFYVSDSEYPNGVTLESIDIYFSNIEYALADETDYEKQNMIENPGVYLYLVECTNGYPSSTIVPYSIVVISPSDYTTDVKYKSLEAAKLAMGSPYARCKVVEGTGDNTEKIYYPYKMQYTPIKGFDDTSVTISKLLPTNFKFDEPIYLPSNKEYAFVISTGSYRYNIYISKLGVKDLLTGKSITRQAYTGSMFRSQNSRTWTTEQNSDVTFKIHKYTFPINQIYKAYYALDYIPYKLDDDTQSNLEIDKTSKFYVDTMTIDINEYVPSCTSAVLKYILYDNDPDTGKTITNNNTWYSFQNSYIQYFSDRYNIKYKDDPVSASNNKETTYLDSKNVYVAVELKTTDENVSPYLDVDYARAVFTQNVVHKISDIDVDISGLTASELETNYSNYTEEQLTYTKFLYNPNNASYRFYYDGAYISNTITLTDDSYDIRVILDAYLPNYSAIEVFVRTTERDPIYFEHYTTVIYNEKSGSSDNLESLFTDTNSVNKLTDGTTKLRVYIANLVDNRVTFTPIAGNILATVCGYVAKTNPSDGTITYKIYIRDITDVESVDNALEATLNKNRHLYFIPSYVVTDINKENNNEESSFGVSFWTAQSYNEDEYVLYNNCLWKALDNVDKDNVPSDMSIVWSKEYCFNINTKSSTDGSSAWLKMVDTTTSSINNTQKFDQNVTSYTEYTYVPEREISSGFSQFAIKVEFYSRTTTDIPYIKNLRAIATI